MQHDHYQDVYFTEWFKVVMFKFKRSKVEQFTEQAKWREVKRGKMVKISSNNLFLSFINQ